MYAYQNWNCTMCRSKVRHGKVKLVYRRRVSQSIRAIVQWNRAFWSPVFLFWPLDLLRWPYCYWQVVPWPAFRKSDVEDDFSSLMSILLCLQTALCMDVCYVNWLQLNSKILLEYQYPLIAPDPLKNMLCK